MNTNDVWELLSEMQIGTIVAWIVVASSIFGVVGNFVKKFIKLIDKYHDTQEEKKDIVAKLDEQNDKFSKAISDLADSVNNLNHRLDYIQDKLHVQEEVNLKQIRNDIITICDEAIISEKISERKFQLLNELFDEYTNVFHSNGYVADSVKKVKVLWQNMTGENADM